MRSFLGVMIIIFSTANALSAPATEKWSSSCHGKTWSGSYDKNSDELQKQFQSIPRDQLRQYLFGEAVTLKHPEFEKQLAFYLANSEQVPSRSTFLDIFIQATQLEHGTPTPMKKEDLCATYRKYFDKYEKHSDNH